MENKGLRYHVLPPARAFDWWVTLLGLETALNSPNIPFVKKFTRGVTRLFVRNLSDPKSELNRERRVWCRYLRKVVNKYSPEEIRAWTLRMLNTEDPTPFIQVLKSQIEYRKERGESITAEDEALLHMPFDELIETQLKPVISIVTNLEMHYWYQIKDILIQKINWVLDSNADVVLQRLRQSGALDFITWHVHWGLHLLSDRSKIPQHSQTNIGLIKIVEYYLGLSDDDESGLGLLWDLGLRGEAPNITWKEVKSKIRAGGTDSGAFEKLQEPIEHVMKVIVDCLRSQTAETILEWSKTDYFIKYCIKSTWNDHLDMIRRTKAKKVVPKEKLITIGYIEDKSCEFNDDQLDLSDDDIISNRIRAQNLPVIDMDSIDAQFDFNRFIKNKKLTKREREVLQGMHTMINDLGCVPLKELTKMFCISESRIHQLLKSIRTKLYKTVEY